MTGDNGAGEAVPVRRRIPREEHVGPVFDSPRTAGSGDRLPSIIAAADAPLRHPGGHRRGRRIFAGILQGLPRGRDHCL